MTCREKLKKEHPSLVANHFYGGCNGCPDDYGYMDVPHFCDCDPVGEKCTKCWNREIPGTEPSKDVKDDVIIEIESLLMNSDLKWQISYDPASGSYHIDID